jgi:hypothetical protein
MEKRKHPRLNKSLVAEVLANEMRLFVITSDLSKNGLFIRSKRCFAADSIVDIEMPTSDGRVSVLRGVVRRTVDTVGSTISGMGIEIVEKDAAYMHFLKSLIGEMGTSEVEESAVPCSPTNSSSINQEINKDLTVYRSDNRQSQRYIVDAGQIAVIIGSSGEATVVDISAGGISLKTEKRLHRDKQYVIKLKRKEIVLTLHGVIKWVSLDEYSQPCSRGKLVPKYTIGIQFTNLLGNQSDEVVQFLDGIPKRDAVYCQDEPIDLSEFIFSDCIEPEEVLGETGYKKKRSFQVERNIGTVEKRRSASFCGSKDQSNLLRNPNRDEVLSILKNPKITETEIEKIAKCHTIPRQAIKMIVQNKLWMSHYGIVCALANNPQTPRFIATTLANKLRRNDLRKLERDRGFLK